MTANIELRLEYGLVTWSILVGTGHVLNILLLVAHRGDISNKT
jgi:hypothetical protein